jgi:hypothetical protein
MLMSIYRLFFESRAKCFVSDLCGTSGASRNVVTLSGEQSTHTHTHVHRAIHLRQWGESRSDFVFYGVDIQMTRDSWQVEIRGFDVDKISSDGSFDVVPTPHSTDGLPYVPRSRYVRHIRIPGEGVSKMGM